MIFGEDANGSTSNRCACGIGLQNGVYDWYFAIGDVDNHTGITPDTDRHTFTLDIPNKQAKLDDQVFSTGTTFVSSYKFYIFARCTSSGASNMCKFKLYSMKVYENDVLSKEWVPVVRNYDGKPGLYNVQGSDTYFYTNKGSGEFTWKEYEMEDAGAGKMYVGVETPQSGEALIPTLTGTSSSVFCSQEASDSGGIGYAWAAFDSSDSTFWSTGYGSTATLPAYVGYDFGETKSICQVTFYQQADSTYTSVGSTGYIAVSTDNSTWTNVASFTSVAAAATHTFTFETVQARYVKLVLTAVNNTYGSYGGSCRMSQFQVYATAGTAQIAQKVEKPYIGVGGVAKKVKKAYIGVNGVAQLCYSNSKVNITTSNYEWRYLYGTNESGGWYPSTTPRYSNDSILFDGDDSTYITVGSLSYSSGSYTLYANPIIFIDLGEVKNIRRVHYKGWSGYNEVRENSDSAYSSMFFKLNVPFTKGERLGWSEAKRTWIASFPSSSSSGGLVDYDITLPEAVEGQYFAFQITLSAYSGTQSGYSNPVYSIDLYEE